MEKIKVLIVAKVRAGGGAEKHIAGLPGPLEERGIEVRCAYTQDGFWQLYRTVYNWRPDIVHFFLPRPYLLGSIACELAFHNSRIMSRRSLVGCYQTPWIRRLEKLLHKRTNILVGNSPAVVKELREEAPKSDIRLIRSGVARNNWLPLPPKGPFTILCVGNAFPYKGHDDLIAAVERIGPGLPEPWQLIFVGRGTEKYGGWRVSGLGYHDDVYPFLAAADIFVLPSHEEGSSNALLEAMMHGVPVIATDVGGNRDAVIPGQTGMLVPPRDPARLGLAILAMAKDPAMRGELANSARAYVSNKFSIGRCINEYEALYRSAVKGT